jgi:hypothetical protein
MGNWDLYGGSDKLFCLYRYFNNEWYLKWFIMFTELECSISWYLMIIWYFIIVLF